MSDLSPVALDLTTDLRLLMNDLLFISDAVKERVWGAAEGPPRTVEESRARYYKPIVEAFAASGAEMLAEFPERVRFLADAYYTLLHERDMAKAEADRYHAELETLRESEHNARLQVQEGAAVNANLAAERDRLIREAALGPDTEQRLREDARQLRAERDRYKALAEQQSATVAEGAKTIGEVRAEMAALQRDTDILRGQWSATRTAYRGTCEQLTEARRELEPMRGELADAKATIAKLTAEKRALKYTIRRLCRILGKAMAGDL